MSIYQDLVKVTSPEQVRGVFRAANSSFLGRSLLAEIEAAKQFGEPEGEYNLGDEPFFRMEAHIFERIVDESAVAAGEVFEGTHIDEMAEEIAAGTDECWGVNIFYGTHPMYDGVDRREADIIHLSADAAGQVTARYVEVKPFSRYGVEHAAEEQLSTFQTYAADRGWMPVLDAMFYDRARDQIHHYRLDEEAAYPEIADTSDRVEELARDMEVQQKW